MEVPRSLPTPPLSAATSCDAPCWRVHRTPPVTRRSAVSPCRPRDGHRPDRDGPPAVWTPLP